MSRYAVFATLLLTVLSGILFAAWPEIDLAEAQRSYAGGGFSGSGTAARTLRWLLYMLPALALVGAFGLWLARKLPGRSLLFLVLSMALGPGLLVNVVLKDHSHRPRPVQTLEFGGTLPFRPWNRFDGACQKNCSFVSGETSAAAWLMAPASLAPPTLRPLAMGVALAVAVITGQTRMAFGGHYLSDVVFAILLTLLVTQGLHRALLPPSKDEPSAS